MQHLEIKEENEMAFVGLTNPYIAKLEDEKTMKYSGCFMCGKAIAMNITANYNEGKLYANNKLAEYDIEFKDGSMTLGTDRLPIEAMPICFGHEVSDDKKEVIYKAQDSANFVGVGFIVQEKIDGVRKNVATIVYKTKFKEPANDYTTKGENIEFKTPSVEGTIASISDGKWKITKVFDTEEEADKWLRTILGDESLTTITPPTTSTIPAGTISYVG